MASTTAFVLGGGGVRGAAEVGMLRGLLDAGVRPDLVVGTSIGAINGAAVAAAPDPSTLDRLERLWLDARSSELLGGNPLHGIRTLVRSRTHVASTGPLRRLLERELGFGRIEDLQVPFQCVAASIEQAAERWFHEGPLVPAVLASCAVPGLLPPVELDGEHYIDGGIVDSIPLGRAVALGADRVFVLHVGRIERALEPPRYPWEAAQVAFEVARRHRFHRELQEAPDGVEVHVLPTGAEPAPATGVAALDFRDLSRTEDAIAEAHRATVAYLAEAGVAS